MAKPAKMYKEQLEDIMSAKFGIPSGFVMVFPCPQQGWDANILTAPGHANVTVEHIKQLARAMRPHYELIETPPPAPFFPAHAVRMTGTLPFIFETDNGPENAQIAIEALRDLADNADNLDRQALHQILNENRDLIDSIALDKWRRGDHDGEVLIKSTDLPRGGQDNRR